MSTGADFAAFIAPLTAGLAVLALVAGAYILVAQAAHPTPGPRRLST